MKFLKDFPYNNIDDGIEYLKEKNIEFNIEFNEETIYHVYWYGEIERKQLLCINSYLKTQNLNKTKLYIWLDCNTYKDNNIEIIPNHKNIEIHKYIPEEQAKNTLLENYKFLNHDKFIKFRSDISRILILNNYGGLYFDLDMILMKDLSPLLGIEFCYTWSYLNKGNNGMLRLKKKSDNCNQIMKKYLNTVSPFNLKNQEFFLGYNQYIFNEDIDIYCLPSILFDPVWILMDTKTKSKYSKLSHLDNFFKNTDEKIEKIKDFFGGYIYAYHWHSRNNYCIEKNSYFEKIEKIFS